jgi:hypothetical protein
MQPDSFDAREADGKNKRNRQSDVRRPGAPGPEGDWIGEAVTILCKGDITKKDDILWGFTPRECEPFLRYGVRDVLFREVVLNFFGVKDNQSEAREKNLKYCLACKKAKKDNCGNCKIKKVSDSEY